MIETDDHIIAMAFVLVKIYSEDKILDCSCALLTEVYRALQGRKDLPLV